MPSRVKKVSLTEASCLSRTASAPHASSGQPEEDNGPRRRITLACVRCRSRKIRCDGAEVCSRCAFSGLTCEYIPVTREENQAARDKKAISKLIRAKATGSSFSSSSDSPSPPATSATAVMHATPPTSPSRSLKRKGVPSTPRPPRLDRRHTEPFKIPRKEEKLSLNILPTFGEVGSTYSLPSPPLWASGEVTSSYDASPAYEMGEDAYFGDSALPAPSYYAVSDGSAFTFEHDDDRMLAPSQSFTSSCQSTPMEATPKYRHYQAEAFEYPSPPQSIMAASPAAGLTYTLPEYPVYEGKPQTPLLPSLARSQSVPFLNQQQRLSQSSRYQYHPEGQSTYMIETYPLQKASQYHSSSPRPLFPYSQKAPLTSAYPYPATGASQPEGLCLFIDSTSRMSIDEGIQGQHESSFLSLEPSSSAMTMSQPTSPVESAPGYPSGPIDWNSRPIRPFPSVMMPAPSRAPFVLPPPLSPTSRVQFSNHPLRQSVSMNTLSTTQPDQNSRYSQPSHFHQSLANSPVFPVETVSMDEVCSNKGL